MAQYVYHPLMNAERQIRLLNLEPGSGVIRCSVRTESLVRSTYHSYEALSYCWGQPSDSKVKILVDDFIFFVTPSLHAALLRLRSDEPRTLWIDAICIDQSNLREKSTQIPLMRDIYSSCWRVVIWLGEHDALTASALEGIEFMASRAQNREQFNYYDWRKVRRAQDAEGAGRYLPLNGVTEILTSAAALTSFFSRPWFTRVWVIQELTLSARAVAICGKYQIDWDLIVKADEVSKTNFEHDLSTLRRFRTWPETMSYDILNRMIMAWHKEATNPRDKIYGLLGLEEVPSGKGMIDVD